MSDLRLDLECNFVGQSIFRQVNRWSVDVVTTNMKILILTFSMPPIRITPYRYSVAVPS
jgi:hypothetical protein